VKRSRSRSPRRERELKRSRSPRRHRRRSSSRERESRRDHRKSPTRTRSPVGSFSHAPKETITALSNVQNVGPKPITLKDIISANPGLSISDAVIRLNAYNTAIARGELPPPLTGYLLPNALISSAPLTVLTTDEAATRSHREM
jgi:hypothetical protein